jgi:DNA-binding response OmpR family regulator
MNNILLADIDTEEIENISHILSMEQSVWNISVINSGKQCLDIIKNGNCPDAVILGMQLTDMSGLDLVERIRDYSDVPVIIFSCNKDMFTLVKAFDSGANDYIIRPFSKAIFVARLKALIRRKVWDIQMREYQSNKGINLEVVYETPYIDSQLK